jgi:hypothetical protein
LRIDVPRAGDVAGDADISQPVPTQFRPGHAIQGSSRHTHGGELFNARQTPAEETIN